MSPELLSRVKNSLRLGIQKIRFSTVTITHFYCVYVDLDLKSLFTERQSEIQTLVLNFMQITVYILKELLLTVILKGC